MLQLRNSPDTDCKYSPAEILFGRNLRDCLEFSLHLDKFSNPLYRPLWRNSWIEKETALRNRMHKCCERLNEHSRNLKPLQVGDKCYVQNMAGNHPTRWDRSGVVISNDGHDSYTLKIDGTGRLTRRNRRFLRKYQPLMSASQPYPSSPPSTYPFNFCNTNKECNNENKDLNQTHSQPQNNEVTYPCLRRSSRVRRPPKRYIPETGRWT